jgi:hypothetical protein
VSGGLTPRGEETLVRLASWMPFEQARDLLQDLVGIQVSKATVRRATLQTGEAALAVAEAEAEHLKQELPQAPAGADKQALSADGAFVHLVGGEWVEVKTVVMGEVTRNKRGEVCTRQISAFSRLAEAERFAEAALVETHRRGLERAAAVCAVQDGAEWLQGLVDYHRADALRILDFAHAAEHINTLGQAVQAAGGRLPANWLAGLLHRLKHQGPSRMLKHLAWLTARYPSPEAQEHLTYLQKREAQMQYPTRSGKQAGRLAQGASKVPTRESSKRASKGPACGFRRQNVNPMLVLRNAVCNQRWNETWAAAVTRRGALRTSRRQADSQQRLTRAFWTLVFWGAHLSRLAHPPVHASPSTTVTASAEHPARRLGSGYSWRKPFLRRPPSTPAVPGEACAKK